MSQDTKYYYAYEDRYRRVYSQGIEYWSADPKEIVTSIAQLDEFLDHYSIMPGNARIIEFGCGEGHIAQHLIEKGFAYLGVDLSPSALEKAKSRAGRVCRDDHFLLGDITDLTSVPSKFYDVGIDNFCWQMLVTDGDRHRYLSEVSRVLRKGGKAYFFEICQEKRFEERVRTFEEFVRRFKPDYDTLEDREAYVDGEMRLIKLPRVPSRFNSIDGYEEELTDGGFVVDKTCSIDGNCVIYCSTDPSMALCANREVGVRSEDSTPSRPRLR